MVASHTNGHSNHQHSSHQSTISPTSPDFKHIANLNEHLTSPTSSNQSQTLLGRWSPQSPSTDHTRPKDVGIRKSLSLFYLSFKPLSSSLCRDFQTFIFLSSQWLWMSSFLNEQSLNLIWKNSIKFLLENIPLGSVKSVWLIVMIVKISIAFSWPVRTNS